MHSNIIALSDYREDEDTGASEIEPHSQAMIYFFTGVHKVVYETEEEMEAALEAIRRKNLRNDCIDAGGEWR